MNIDERIQALTINMKQVMKDIEALRAKPTTDLEALWVLVRQDGEKICALFRIAEAHERR